jgi:hypothetical protein
VGTVNLKWHKIFRRVSRDNENIIRYNCQVAPETIVPVATATNPGTILDLFDSYPP